jgi:hypothetical protein
MAQMSSDEECKPPERLNLLRDTTKKRYHTPQLFEYGTLRELTRSVGSKGNPDGKVIFPNKTAIGN